MELNEIKEILKQIETITFSKHFYGEKVKLRAIAEEEIKTHLKAPDRLIVAEDQGDEPQGHKYALLFSKSNKYDLKVVISVKEESLNVITAHIQNIKKRKVYQQWLEKQK